MSSGINFVPRHQSDDISNAIGREHRFKKDSGKLHVNARKLSVLEEEKKSGSYRSSR
jgi:hypothetical protein